MCTYSFFFSFLSGLLLNWKLPKLGNDRGATRKMASQGLSNSQTNISSKTQPENVLALLPRNMMVVMVPLWE
jgi:hypothetical protein